MGATNSKIQLRRDTAANWSTYNPTLSAGEPGFETDTGKLKIGDGRNSWSSLDYISSSNEATEFKSYNVGPIEDKALWLRVAKLNLTSMGSASGTFVINYKTIVTDLETAETKTYFLGSAKFDLGASTTVLGGKQRYSLEVTPIFSSLIPFTWGSAGQEIFDDEFDYEMLLTSIGSGSGLTVYGISHVRLIADPDDVDEVYLEIFFNNSTLRDEKIFEIELSNNKNIVLLDEITQGSIFTDVFEHKIALNEGDTFYKNSATLTHSRIDGLVVDDNTMILFKDSTNNYYRFGWVDNSFVKESMYPASGGGIASGEILETYHHDSLEDGKYIIWSWVPCDITEVLSLEGDTNGFAIVLKDYYIETKTLEDTPVGQITLEQIFGELYNDLINI